MVSPLAKRGEDCIFRGYIDGSERSCSTQSDSYSLTRSCFTILAGRVDEISRFEYCFTDFLRDDPFHSMHNAMFKYYVRLRGEEFVPTIELCVMSPHSRCNSAAKKALFSCVSRACLFEGRARVLSLC